MFAQPGEMITARRFRGVSPDWYQQPGQYQGCSSASIPEEVLALDFDEEEKSSSSHRSSAPSWEYQAPPLRLSALSMPSHAPVSLMTEIADFLDGDNEADLTDMPDELLELLAPQHCTPGLPASVVTSVVAPQPPQWSPQHQTQPAVQAVMQPSAVMDSPFSSTCVQSKAGPLTQQPGRTPGAIGSPAFQDWAYNAAQQGGWLNGWERPPQQRPAPQLDTRQPAKQRARSLNMDVSRRNSEGCGHSPAESRVGFGSSSGNQQMDRATSMPVMVTGPNFQVIKTPMKLRGRRHSGGPSGLEPLAVVGGAPRSRLAPSSISCNRVISGNTDAEFRSRGGRLERQASRSHGLTIRTNELYKPSRDSTLSP